MNVPGSNNVAAFREWTERRAERIRGQGSNVVRTFDHNYCVLPSGIFKPHHVGANVEGLIIILSTDNCNNLLSQK